MTTLTNFLANIPAVILLILSVASFHKDWFNPVYLRDADGNPPQFPMPYVTMVACIATAGLDLLVGILGSLGVNINAVWSILVFIACVAAIAAELVPNIHDWKMMNWTSVIMIVLNWVTFVILVFIY